ncbi:hypothetical protein [Oceanicoccus sp. KOV_DT_Chl]|uniref:hypothetical protein n=1 Tax=Oceanicoccus sp. KOV_DT_Chl TaxID=1904639 RepID=UPI000C7A85A0|nr:hypothetical protein [Oceanicoccus sp. KOV_DT_Chl]
MNSQTTLSSMPSLLDWAPVNSQGVNIRRRAYIASGIMIPGAFCIAWSLILLGIINPMPADKYVSISLFIGYWAALFAFVDNKGEQRTWTAKWHEFLVVWLITSGGAQLGWELPAVYMKTAYLYPLGAELKPDELLLWPWWLYSVADTRYMRPHEAQLAHEALLAHSGFFEILAAYWLSKGRHYKTALGMAILANWGAFYGNTSVIYLGEILVDFRNLADGSWGFWLKWVGLNLQWSVLSPAAAIGGIWLLVQRVRAETAAEINGNG